MMEFALKHVLRELKDAKENASHAQRDASNASTESVSNVKKDFTKTESAEKSKNVTQDVKLLDTTGIHMTLNTTSSLFVTNVIVAA